MYIKSDCPYGNRTCYHELRFRVKKEILFDGENYREHQMIKDIEIKDTLSEEELARCIVYELKDFMYHGITVDEFCKLLKKYYGVAAKYCCDLIQRMKNELDMYCPDRQHLYYVEARSP